MLSLLNGDLITRSSALCDEVALRTGEEATVESVWEEILRLATAENDRLQTLLGKCMEKSDAMTH